MADNAHYVRCSRACSESHRFDSRCLATRPDVEGCGASLGFAMGTLAEPARSVVCYLPSGHQGTHEALAEWPQDVLVRGLP